ncbi:hypothetical protein EAW52_24700 [Pseudomonas sp. LTJR-52]|nr:hypothetical protein EAW52_24700 [Pseudomonas sp. LTJR-52]
MGYIFLLVDCFHLTTEQFHMQAYSKPDGTVHLVLKNQAEIDAVWAIASSIGGTTQTLRAIFCDSASTDEPRLLDVLLPYISKVTSEFPNTQPHDAGALLESVYGQCIEGTLFFRTLGKQEEWTDEDE